MSVFNQLTILEDFYAVTTNKGDIIVNDGIKNANLAIGADGYVLTADTTETLGIKWAPATGGGGGSIMSSQQKLNNLFSTNSTTPIEVPDFTYTPVSGNYLIHVNFTYAISRSNNILTVGLYKNNILLSGSTRTLRSNGSNLIYMGSIQYYTSSGGVDDFTLKINSDASNSTVTLYSGNIIYSRISNITQLTSTTQFTTNSTTPIEILDITQTPGVGTYIILCNMTYGLSRNNRTFTIGTYINGALITNSPRVLSPNPSSRHIFQQNFLFTVVNNLDEVNFRVNTSNTDTTVNIYERSVLLIPMS
jgi:hypothetical protein